MSEQNEEKTNLGDAGEGESKGKHDIMTTLKSSIIWLVVIVVLLVLISWGAVEFDMLPYPPSK
jgi:hypothetical protein